MKRYAFLKRSPNDSDESFHCCGRAEDLAREAYLWSSEAGSVETIKPVGQSALYSLMEEPSPPQNSIQVHSKPLTVRSSRYYLPPPPNRTLHNAKSLSNVNQGNLQRQRLPQRKSSFPDRTLAEQQFDDLPEFVKSKNCLVDSALTSPTSTSSKKVSGLSMRGISNFFRRSPRQLPLTATPTRASSSSTLSPESFTSTKSSCSSSYVPTPTRSKKSTEDNPLSCDPGNSKAAGRVGLCTGSPRKKLLDPTDGD